MPEEQLKQDLTTIVDKLTEAGCRVVLHTIPPFDYAGEHIAIWQNVNSYIREALASRVAMVFDVVSCLGLDDEQPHLSRYGGHPNAGGCAVWADALYEKLCESTII